MSDVHVPFHSIEAVTAALELGVMEQVDCIFLGGDFMDFYSISSYEKDPRKRSFMEEIKTGKEMLKRIREVFLSRPSSSLWATMKKGLRSTCGEGP